MILYRHPLMPLLFTTTDATLLAIFGAERHLFVHIVLHHLYRSPISMTMMKALCYSLTIVIMLSTENIYWAEQGRKWPMPLQICMPQDITNVPCAQCNLLTPYSLIWISY